MSDLFLPRISTTLFTLASVWAMGLLSPAVAQTGMPQSLVPPIRTATPVALNRGEEDLFAATLAGRFAQGVADPVLAAQAWSQAYLRQPDDPELLARALEANLQAGFVNRAIELAKAAPPARRTDDAALILAINAFAKGQYGDVSTLLSGANFLPSRRVIADHLRAYALLGQNDNDGGVNAASTATGIPALDRSALISRAMILESAGRPEEAGILFQSAIDANVRWPLAINAYAQFLARTGRRSEGVALYQRLISAGGQDSIGLSAALSQFEATRTPPRAWPLSTRAAIGLTTLAQSLIAENRSGPPSGLLSLIAHLDPQFDGIAMVLANQRLDDGKPVLARQALERVAATSPYFLAARTELVWLEFSTNQDSAVSLARQALRTRPRDEAATRLLADVLAANRQDGEAEILYSNLINAGKRASRNDDALWPLYFGRAGTRERLGKWPQAQSDFRLALAAAPNQPSVLNSFGYALADRGENLSEALEMLRTAVRLRPRSASILDSLGWAQFKAGRFEEAVDTLERAAGMDSAIAEISDHLGDAYWRTDRLVQARLEWARAVRLTQNDADKAKITEKIATGLPTL